jgi:2-hydroxy-3-keto-5-methylthiopentenyl-1-phosphate phosphatase
MNRIVFCDFDGTITIAETFVAMLKEFAPEVSARLMPEIYAKRLTLRRGVRQMLESIPAAKYAQMVEFVRTQPIRDGFGELLDFLQAQNIPFVVISGGLRGMVEANLAPYLDRITAIHAIDIDASGEYLQAHSQYESGTEMVAKAEIMSTYPAGQTIAIGDSITDWNMALAADIIFARPPLTEFLTEHQKPYLTWDNFHDLRYQLATESNAAN